MVRRLVCLLAIALFCSITFSYGQNRILFYIAEGILDAPEYNDLDGAFFYLVTSVDRNRPGSSWTSGGSSYTYYAAIQSSLAITRSINETNYYEPDDSESDAIEISNLYQRYGPFGLELFDAVIFPAHFNLGYDSGHGYRYFSFGEVLLRLTAFNNESLQLFYDDEVLVIPNRVLGEEQYDIGFINPQVRSIEVSLYPERPAISFAEVARLLFDVGSLIFTATQNIPGPFTGFIINPEALDGFLGGLLSRLSMMPNSYAVISMCPVDIRLTDPQGNMFSKDIAEIAGAKYIEIDKKEFGTPIDMIVIDNPLPGSYLINVIPDQTAAPEDTFSLLSMRMSDGNSSAQVLVSESSIGSNALAFTDVVTENYISIDIAPGLDVNIIKLYSGLIPVVIKSTNTFDAKTIIPTSVRFGKTGREAPPRNFFFPDIDNDGDRDLCLFFEVTQTNLDLEDSVAYISGLTNTGKEVHGSDSITIIMK